MLQTSLKLLTEAKRILLHTIVIVTFPMHIKRQPQTLYVCHDYNKAMWLGCFDYTQALRWGAMIMLGFY